MFERFVGDRVLLLQGPIGPFFRHVAAHLRARGAEITKVNFNAGDDWYYPNKDTVRFKGAPKDWPTFLEQLVATRSIDTIVVFGDSRFYHGVAKELAEKLGLRFYVFEEGYIRPNFITFEEGGTNYDSRVPTDPNFFLKLFLADLPSPVQVGNKFLQAAQYAIVYSIVMTLLGSRYPRYQHHRDLNAFRQCYWWWKGWFRKALYLVKERNALRELSTALGGYFLVPLQVHNDFQVRNSRFTSVPEFMREVVHSFAASAPSDACLVLKHHPGDRGERDYTSLVRELAKETGLGSRLRYIHDLHLPTLLKNALGTVVINSTVGLSSVFHNTPVKCLHGCVYTAVASQQSLSEFWKAPTPVNTRLARRFILWLRLNVQLNGTFYNSKFWAIEERAANSQLSDSWPESTRIPNL